MPTYTFLNSDTGEEFDIVLRIAELDDYKRDHPQLSLVHRSAPRINRDSGKQKPDEGFRDVLKSIKKASGRGNHINTF
jgi:hypothetical protein